MRLIVSFQGPSVFGRCLNLAPEISWQVADEIAQVLDHRFTAANFSAHVRVLQRDQNGMRSSLELVRLMRLLPLQHC